MTMCSFRWYGPRVDVPEADAIHVCGEEDGHERSHLCVCGATAELVVEEAPG